ncbi:hypothetical protein [Paenibacillus sp. MBLB4367]|uniref:hypothetical protein n=1 Tax=Paenibacillus sp. MBLB4367 TaxID=3384767 RepID=UPI003908300C
MKQGKVKIRVTYEHVLNFGTAEKPINKTAGDVVECEKDIADRLVQGGFAAYTKEDETNGK